ncbi:hypothetical protein M885DRAFT_500968 [Pelagophyceae sp. CCMP2097]|nr:hypothetical protein M885DRAFT_500968 [Pelagophyceae sp. CCMP2097]
MEDNFKANSSLRSDRLAHERMDMQQKEDESVADWQARVKKLVRDFPKLTPTIVKSQSDIMEKFNQGLLGELRNMTLSMRLASRNSSDSKELTLDKYNGFVESVKDAAATMQLSQESNKQRALALLYRGGFKDNHKQEDRLALQKQEERKHADLKRGSSPRRIQAISDKTKTNQALCWGFARSRKCPFGGDCRRVHTNARNWISTSSFKNENENSKDIIKQIAAEDESGVSNKNPKATRWKATRDDGPTAHNTIQDADERLKRQGQKIDKLTKAVSPS